MTGEWYKFAIGVIADVIGGGTPSTKDEHNFNGDIPWITPKDLSGYPYRYISRGERNISQKGLANSSARLLPKGAILLTTRAPVGYVAIAANRVTTNQGFRSLVLREGFHPEFVYYLLKSSTDYLKAHASGTTFGELSGTALKELQFLFPPLSEQRTIAHMLGTLDDKIELLRRMNETLEQMARAIFKAWFVDFDPVRLRRGGPMWPPEKGIPTQGCSYMPPEILALFPDSFEDSPLGKIPKGWRAGTIGEDFDLTMGQSPPGKTYNEVGDGMPFFQGRADFGFRYPSVRVYCTAPTRLAKPGDTLVSVRAPVGDINMALNPCSVGRGVAAIRHKTGSRSYTYYTMHSYPAPIEK